MTKRDKKFTPGPWAVSTSPDYFENGAAVIRAKNQCVVAVLTDIDWPVKCARDPNANLISAAPELLEALEEIHRAYCRDYHAYCGSDRYYKVKSAIKKACGEKP